MARNSKYTVPYRRKREGKTNYHKRRKFLTSNNPRLVVRRSNRAILLQLVEFKPSGDRVLASASSRELAKYGWKASGSSTSAAYLTGLLLSKKVKKGTSCLLDIGFAPSVKGSVLYAAAKGCIEGGLSLPCSQSVLPGDDRIMGEHIAAYAQALKSDAKRYERQFGAYIKSGLDPQKFSDHVSGVKQRIVAQ